MTGGAGLLPRLAVGRVRISRGNLCGRNYQLIFWPDKTIVARPPNCSTSYRHLEEGKYPKLNFLILLLPTAEEVLAMAALMITICVPALPVVAMRG